MGTVVVHDYFAIRGGGERLALLMAEGLEASLVSGYRTAESFEPSMFPAEHLELGLARLLRIPGRRAFALAPRFARQRPRMARFRNRIFSGVAAPFAAPEREGGATNLFYCHTPPRFLYDLREHYSEGRLGRALATRAALGLFQAGYERAIGRMDLVVANSNAVRTRIERFLGRSADVVHPPCEVDRYAWREPEGYYLSMARLAPLKRVDRIVAAFLAMPEKRLVVASDGEERDRLRRQAQGAPNIHFTGPLDDAALRHLIGGAIATIYIPREEDFGMSAVESLAAGKPVIGVAEGGLPEIIRDPENGLLLQPGFSLEDLVAAVAWMSPAQAARMRNDCRHRAEMFGASRFINDIRERLC